MSLVKIHGWESLSKTLKEVTPFLTQIVQTFLMWSSKVKVLTNVTASNLADATLSLQLRLKAKRNKLPRKN